MQIKDWIIGAVELRLVCADPQAPLNFLLKKGVQLKDVRWLDELTVELTVPGSARKSIQLATQKFQCDIAVKKILGLHAYGQKALKRAFLLLGLLFFLILSVYVQNHILFIEVTGNSAVADREIIANAEACGLIFGASRKDIRSEQVKNMLLEKTPQLQWVGINTAGCVATISVRERTETEGTFDRDMTPASIIASMNGTVCAVTASKGTILCQVGQQVTAGQTLISGMNTCGEIMLMTRAQGEVMANTEREMTIKTIPPTAARGHLQRSEQRFSVIFGKNIIKFFKDSGILDTSCVKINRKYDLQLPKGFVLPVSLCVEHIMLYRSNEIKDDEDDDQWLLQQGRQYIASQMIAGQIIDTVSERYTDQFVTAYTVKFFCREMIGQIKKEELFYVYGKNS